MFLFTESTFRIFVFLGGGRGEGQGGGGLSK